MLYGPGGKHEGITKYRSFTARNFGDIPLLV